MRMFSGTNIAQMYYSIAQAFGSGTLPISETRIGPARDLGVSTLSLSDPRQRWQTGRSPSINPAFAVAEAIWIVCGRDDLAFLLPWNTSYGKFVGHDAEVVGAYGRRLCGRSSNQLFRAYTALKNNPTSRQVVLQIWNPDLDLPDELGRASHTSVPCNICSFLKVRDDRLHWTQILRSNDFYLGVPYNFVQFTFLQEIIAGWLGLDLGTYTHFADSLHCYEADLELVMRSSPPGDDGPTVDYRLPYEESIGVLGKLESVAVELSCCRRAEDIGIAIEETNLTGPYLGLAYVLASEIARRKVGTAQAEAYANKVRDAPLRELVLSWIREREVAKKKMPDDLKASQLSFA